MNRISLNELLAATQLVWFDKSTSRKVAHSCYETIAEVEKRKITYCSGRKARALVAGLFYIMGYRFDNVKKQNELANKLGTTDATVRKSYRKWLLDFPDLFVDVISKMAQDENLKYFILIDLAKRSS